MNILFTVYLHEIAIQAQGHDPWAGLFIDQSKGKCRLVCCLPAQNDDFGLDLFCLEEKDLRILIARDVSDLPVPALQK